MLSSSLNRSIYHSLWYYCTKLEFPYIPSCIKHMPMDRNIDNTKITEDAILSIELKSRESSSTQSHLDHTPIDQERSENKSVTMKRSPSPSSPRLPDDSAGAGSSAMQGKSTYRKRGRWWSLIRPADNHGAGDLPLSRDEPEPSRKTDCLLLDYQNQLFLLESLNRRSSRKAKQLRWIHKVCDVA